MMDAATCPARPYLDLTAWTPAEQVEWETASGPVQPPLGQGANPAGWDHADWPGVA